MIIFANNAVSQLAVALLSSQTTLTVTTGTGELFPVPGVGEYFKLTLEDRRNRTIEICHCTGRAGDVLTVVRAQEDTTALNFALGSTVANRFTRDTPDAIIAQYPSPNPWYLGPFAVAPTTDNEGDPLVAGQKYFNTVSNIEFTWTGASWVDVTGGVSALTSSSGTFLLVDPSADFDGIEIDFGLRYTDYSAATQTPDVTVAEQFLVSLDGIWQKAGFDYTIPMLGTIRFTKPPASDVAFLGVWVALTSGGTPGPTGPTGPAGPAGAGTGDVIGPASAVDGTPAVFDLATGKLIKNITYAAFKTLLVLVKGDVGLGNIDNTSDANKAVSTATQTALDAKVTGPASVTDDLPAIFDGTTGKLIKQKTYAAFKTLLALVKGDVGLGNVDNTADTAKPVSTAQQTALNGKQDLDSDLTTIAGLTATSDSFMQSKSSAWAARTIAQVKTDLGLTGTNSGDQTSIVGISSTKAQFDTAANDGNFTWVGDALAGKLTGGNWKVFYTDGSGVITEVALGVAGTVLTSAGAAAAPSFSAPSGVPTTIVKAADQSRTAVTLFDDAEFTFSMLANTNYKINIRFYLTNSASGGFRIGLVGPASPTSVLGTLIGLGSGTARQSLIATSGSGSFVEATSSENFNLDIQIIWINGANAGTFKIQTGQGANNGTTSFEKNSSMTYATF